MNTSNMKEKLAVPSDLSSPSIPGRVTIVVPVYGDWPSLKACISSVLQHADPAVYDLLLVNDCGPQADEIEAGIIGMTFGYTHVRYARNDTNLGFVGTCNRAVLELDQTDNDILLLNSDAEITPGALDEMRAVLALSERHAVACPRSNDATIATIPFFQRERLAERDRDRAVTVFQQLASSLPRYYVAPVAVGFCFLVRRSLIANHDLFDKVFGKGYNEESDFCLRLNALGYNSVIANHAFVHHIGSTSFGSSQRAELERANSRILESRYPFFPAAVVHFIRNGYTALDRFSDLIVERSEPVPPKILIDLHHLSLHYDGSTRNALSFLELLASLPAHERARVTVAAPQDAADFFDLARFGLRLLNYAEIDEIFDVGVAIAPLTAVGQLVSMNRFCARWVVTHLDIIALRSWQLRLQVPYKTVVVHHALRFADRVVAISQATVDDTNLFFPDLADSLPARVRVIHQGSGLDPTKGSSEATSPATAAIVADGDYLLIVGNGFPHKQVSQAVRALADSSRTLVVLGGGTSEKLAGHHDGRVRRITAGSLSDADVLALYNAASAVVFPSAYEGFGLPLPESVSFGAPVVIFDTQVAREVVQSLKLAERVVFFDRFNALPAAVDTALDLGKIPGSVVRTIADYNAELWQEVLRVAASPIDVARLETRDTALRELSMVSEELLTTLSAHVTELDLIKSSSSFGLARRIAQVMGPLKRILSRVGPVSPARTQLREFDRS